jgi:hypothetical protein
MNKLFERIYKLSESSGWEISEEVQDLADRLNVQIYDDGEAFGGYDSNLCVTELMDEYSINNWKRVVRFIRKQNQDKTDDELKDFMLQLKQLWKGE